MSHWRLPEIDVSVRRLIDGAIGEPCCRQHIGDNRSLFLGFGEVVRRKTVLGESQHGKWEVGTYYSSWRIVRAGVIVCGRQDVVDSVDELREAMNSIEWGRFSVIRQLTAFDVRVEFDNDVFVDILGTVAGDDEVFHFLCPDHLVVAFYVTDGWKSGASDKPWSTGA